MASALGLSGVLFLEKSDETRHVNVLLGLDERQVLLYDPLSGVKLKSCDETQLGLYCRPIGALRDEFEKHEQLAASGECTDVWEELAQRADRLKRFLRQHDGFIHLFSAAVSHRFASLDLPALQRRLRPSDCAPISLFVVSLLPFGVERTPRTKRGKAAVVVSSATHDLIDPHEEREAT